LSRTVTTTRETEPSASVSRKTHWLPGFIGQYGLSISVVNSLGSIGNGLASTGRGVVAGAVVAPPPVGCVALADPLPPHAAAVRLTSSVPASARIAFRISNLLGMHAP